jgi:hypothetical protein
MNSSLHYACSYFYHCCLQALTYICTIPAYVDLSMFAHAQNLKLLIKCSTLKIIHAQGEAAAYCRSNGMAPISLDSPAKEQEFTSK